MRECRLGAFGDTRRRVQYALDLANIRLSTVDLDQASKAISVRTTVKDATICDADCDRDVLVVSLSLSLCSKPKSMWQGKAASRGNGQKDNCERTRMSGVANEPRCGVVVKNRLIPKNEVKDERNGRCQKKSESPLSNGLTGGSHELTGPRYIV